VQCELKYVQLRLSLLLLCWNWRVCNSFNVTIIQVMVTPRHACAGTEERRKYGCFAVGGDGWLAPRSSCLIPWQDRYPLYRTQMGPRDPSGRAKKISPSPEFDRRPVHPVASRYTDWLMLRTVACWEKHRKIWVYHELFLLIAKFEETKDGHKQIIKYLWLN
jgi:hypothetical protein